MTPILFVLSNILKYFTRIDRYLGCGTVAGPFFILLFTLCHVLLLALDYFAPRYLIDIAPNYNE